MGPTNPNRRIADEVNDLRKEHEKAFDRVFTRVEAIEKGLMGTPSEPGIIGKFEVLKNDITHRLINQATSLRINNWLTGLIAATLIAAALKMVLGHP